MFPISLLGPDDDAATAGIMALGCAVWAFIFLLALAVLAFQVWLFWRVFSKAGYNGAMALLVLIPAFGPLIAMCMLAFGDWPIHRERR